MGGSVGGALKDAGRAGLGVMTFGGSELANQALSKNGSGPLGQSFLDWAKSPGITRDNPYISGPFSLDPNQVIRDQNAITGMGQQQYDEMLKSIDTNSSDQQKYAGQTLDRILPSVYEDMNSRHLLNSSATGEEVGRQASYLAQDVASQRANAIQQALSGKQGFDTGALQRNLSLEDFVNQANVSKSIGAAFTPQAPTGKQNFATGAQGVGALAPLAKLAIK